MAAITISGLMNTGINIGKGANNMEDKDIEKAVAETENSRDMEEQVRKRLLYELESVEIREKQLRKILSVKNPELANQKTEKKKKGSKRFQIDKEDAVKIGKSFLLGLSGLVVAVGPVAVGLAPAGWWTPIIAAGTPVIVNAAAKYIKDNTKTKEGK